MVFAFDCLLDQEDGTPAEPPTLHPAVPNWQVGEHDSARRRQDAPRHRDQARE